MWILHVSLLACGLLLLLCVRHFRTTSHFRASYRMLAFVYLAICLWILLNSLFYFVRYYPVEALRPYALPVDLALLYCLNPLIYFFFRKLSCDTRECLWRNVLPHFIVPLLALMLIPLYLLPSASLRAQAIMTDNFDNSMLFALLHGGFFLQSFIYVLYIHFCITKHKRDNYRVCRGNLMISLRGFRFVLFAGLAVVLLHGCYYLGEPSSEHHHLFRLMAVDAVGFLLVGVSMGDTGSRQIDGMVAGWDANNVRMQAVETPIPKKEPVRVEERERMMLALRMLMENEKLYLLPDCHLDLLAAKLNTNKTVLSYVLNYEDEAGCARFINQYRLQHALQLIDEGAYLLHKVDTIARMSGFSHRVTFSRVCKELRGFCPAEYIRTKKRF